MSEEKGIKAALLYYIDGKGVLLRPNVVPLVGGNAVDYISQGADTTYTMTWEPSGGTVSKSGDLGYTYGVYSLKPKTRDTVLYGTYVSVWKRQEDGKWKFLLETGNEGID
jgi:ketosteroid isomerase-like protein